eukprot:TRINITY_DN17240_c0_g1_i1.p1 TRINITY_DN17240_c0_g1~~TRINITY_DN17240_c0_g1_i1.p1  ORF type:complete len:1745 (+),score=378.98 TRINITY_DN17240_c0_g1_i1:602-5236(+)
MTKHCHQLGIDEFEFFLGSLFLTLFRWTSHDRIVINVESANRCLPGSERIIGPLGKFLPICFGAEEKEDVRSYFLRLRKEWRESQRFGYVPFESLESAHSSTCVRIFSRNGSLPQNKWIEESAHKRPMRSGTLEFNIDIVNGRYIAEVRGCPKEDSELFLMSFLHFCNSLISVNAILWEIPSSPPLVDGAPRREFGGGPVVSLEGAWSLHEGVEHFARSCPTNVAVDFHGVCMTYTQLNEAANKLARVLSQFPEGGIIGIFYPRSLEVYIAILAVLKAGCGYAPLDELTPLKRVQIIASTCNFAALITHSSLATQEDFDVNVVHFDDPAFQASVSEQNGSNLGKQVSSNSIAYVIHTSGSTGLPKAAALSHLNVRNYILATHAPAYTRITSSDRVLQFASIGFDIHVLDLIHAWSYGACLVSMAKDVQRDVVGSLVPFMKQSQVTHACLTNTVGQMIDARECPSMKEVVFAGEKLFSSTVSSWRRAGVKVFNGYGPAETTILTHIAEVQEDFLHVGRGFCNVGVRVVDKNLRDTPVGAIGEIILLGHCVGLCYLNNQEETSKRFIECDGERAYRSGDLGYFCKNGDLVIVGRADLQVKIRGNRVELTEISAMIERVEMVKDCLVLFDGGELMALVVLHAGHEAGDKNRDKLVQLMTEELPSYMVPTKIAFAPYIPLTANGKACYKTARKLLNESSTSHKKQFPSTNLELQLAAIWSEVLNLNVKAEEVDVLANFFHEGGHSILASAFVSRVRNNLGFQSVSLRQFYSNPTISAMAVELQPQGGVVIPGLEEKLVDVEMEQTEVDSEETKPQSALSCFLGYLFVYLVFGIICVLVLVPYLYVIQLLVTAVNSNLAWIFFSPVLVLCMFLYTMLLCVAVKWILVGRMRSKFVVDGSFEYYRVWLFSLIRRTLFEFSASSFAGTFVLNFFYRMMGARIGNWVYLGSTCIDYPDMIEIQDYCVLSSHQVKLVSGQRRRNGIDLGRISIQEKSSIGAQVTIQGGSIVGRLCVVEPLTCVNPTTIVQDGLVLQGVPARTVGQNLIAEGAFSYSGFCRFMEVATWQGLTSLLVCFSKSLFIMLALLVNVFFGFGSSFLEIAAWLSMILVAYEVAGSVWSAVINRLALVGLWGREIECELYSMAFLQHELAKAVVRSSNMIIIIRGGLPGLWNLQLLGIRVQNSLAKIFVPLDTIITRPDLVEVKGLFFTGSCTRIDSEHVRNGRLMLSKIRFLEDTIIGNNSYVGGGRIQFTEKKVVGAMTCVLADRTQLGDMVIGSPAFSLNVSDNEDTSSPSVARLWFWLIFQSVALLLNCAFVGLFCAGLYELCNVSYALIGVWMLVVIPFVIVLAPVALLAAYIILKWVLIGKYKTNVVHPFYGWYSTRKQLLVVFEMCTGFLAVLFEGSGLINLFYKLKGARIAMSSQIFTNMIIETDTLSVGEDVFIGADSVVQCHMVRSRGGFEFAEISIKDKVTIGSSCVILPGAVLGEKCTIGDQSLVMQMEHLPPRSSWRGSPCELSKRSSAGSSDVAVDVGSSATEMSMLGKPSSSAQEA